MVFLWFSYGYPIKTFIFPLFSYSVPMVFPTFESRPPVPRCYHLQVPPHSRLLGGLVGSGGPHLCPSPFFDFFVWGWNLGEPLLGTGYIYIYICIYIYIYIYACIYIYHRNIWFCKYVYIYIYTYVHTFCCLAMLRWAMGRTQILVRNWVIKHKLPTNHGPSK